MKIARATQTASRQDQREMQEGYICVREFSIAADSLELNRSGIQLNKNTQTSAALSSKPSQPSPHLSYISLILVVESVYTAGVIHSRGRKIFSLLILRPAAISLLQAGKLFRHAAHENDVGQRKKYHDHRQKVFLVQHQTICIR